MISDDFNEGVEPLDVIENIADKKNWEFDRVTDNQIAMAREGQWKTYSVTVAHSKAENPEKLRIICTYELECPDDKLLLFYETLNGVNDALWDFGVTYWKEQKLIVVRGIYRLLENTPVSEEEMKAFIDGAVNVCEKFYPALQMVCWADKTPQQALKSAIESAPGMRRQ